MYKYCYTCVLDSSYACVLILLLHMCPHTAIYVSAFCYIAISYSYICVLILLYQGSMRTLARATACSPTIKAAYTSSLKPLKASSTSSLYLRQHLDLCEGNGLLAHSAPRLLVDERTRRLLYHLHTHKTHTQKNLLRHHYFCR